MGRGPLYDKDYRPMFSGHETFPLRYGWLKKVYDAVVEDSVTSCDKSVFRSDDAIARFGVGKNMVASMRHWATYGGIIVEPPSTGRVETTPIGDFLFGPDGVDPFLENPTSLWLIHWLLCSGCSGKQFKTTWYWVFNQYSGQSFRRDELVAGLLKLADLLGWPRVSETTVRRDVECFVRTYEVGVAGKASSVEDVIECPLGELALIQGAKGGNYHLIRGPKPSLSPGVFAYALDSFWNYIGATKTLSFETVAHEPGSPGRVFLLDEPDLAERLLALEDVTGGRFRWSETAGLKQVIRSGPLDDISRHLLLSMDYR